jgi:hypothetical protein
MLFLLVFWFGENDRSVIARGLRPFVTASATTVPYVVSLLSVFGGSVVVADGFCAQSRVLFREIACHTPTAMALSNPHNVSMSMEALALLKCDVDEKWNAWLASIDAIFTTCTAEQVALHAHSMHEAMISESPAVSEMVIDALFACYFHDDASERIAAEYKAKHQWCTTMRDLSKPRRMSCDWSTGTCAPGETLHTSFQTPKLPRLCQQLTYKVSVLNIFVTQNQRFYVVPRSFRQWCQTASLCVILNSPVMTSATTSPLQILSRFIKPMKNMINIHRTSTIRLSPLGSDTAGGGLALRAFHRECCVERGR